MKAILLVSLFLFSIQGYALGNKEQMEQFLRVAYCDVLGVKRDENNGNERKYFQKHLNDLVTGRKTPADIVTYFLSVKSEHSKNPLGTKCTESYSSKETLKESFFAIDRTYRDALGVARSSSDTSYLKHLNNLYSGKKTLSDVENHLRNWKSCNQAVGSTKYPIRGESSSSGASSVFKTSSVKGCPYEKVGNVENVENVENEGDVLPESISFASEIIFSPIGVVRLDRSMQNQSFCAGGYSWDDNQLEISAEGFLQDEINKCVSRSLSFDSSCFREELLFKKLAMDCQKAQYFSSSREAGLQTEACINEAKTSINAILQQKKCERRVTFNYHHSLDIDGMFTSPTYQGIQTSIDLDFVKNNIEGKSYRKDDLTFLKCISQASFSAERKLYLDRINLYSKMRTQCNIHPNVFYECWTEGSGKESCLEHFSHDSRFNSQSIVRSFQEDYVQRAKDFKYVPRYFRATKDNPVISDGVKYWGFDYYFQLDTDGKLVWGYAYLPTHTAKKTPVYKNELQFDSVTREVLWTTSASPNMLSVNTQQRADKCSDKFEYYRKDLVKQDQMYIAKLESEAYAIGCTGESEGKCDHIALVELSIPAKLEAKKAELHGKLLDKLKNDPSCVDSTLLSSLVKLPFRELFTTLNVSGTTHTEKECINAGGKVISESGVEVCMFTAPACPIGWTQHANWSATESVSTACSVPEVNKKISCLGKENTIAIPAANSTLLLSGHSWANKEVEQKIYYKNSGNFERSQSYSLNPNMCSNSSQYRLLEALSTVPTVPSCTLYNDESEAMGSRSYNTISMFKLQKNGGEIVYALDSLYGSSYEFSDRIPSQKFVLKTKITAIGCK